MLKKLSKVGSSKALILDKTLLALMNMNHDDSLGAINIHNRADVVEIRIENNELIVTAVNARQAELWEGDVRYDTLEYEEEEINRRREKDIRRRLYQGKWPEVVDTKYKEGDDIDEVSRHPYFMEEREKVIVMLTKLDKMIAECQEKHDGEWVTELSRDTATLELIKRLEQQGVFNNRPAKLNESFAYEVECLISELKSYREE